MGSLCGLMYLILRQPHQVSTILIRTAEAQGSNLLRPHSHKVAKQEVSVCTFLSYQ